MIKRSKNFFGHGFTLVELLVVISIIAILASFIIASLSESRAQARNAQRMNDLQQIQTALELYYNRFNEYPDDLTDLLLANNGKASFIDTIPTDPLVGRESDDGYQYESDGTTYGVAAQDDAGNDWCYFRTYGSEAFSEYHECPFN